MTIIDTWGVGPAVMPAVGVALGVAGALCVIWIYNFWKRRT